MATTLVKTTPVFKKDIRAILRFEFHLCRAYETTIIWKDQESLTAYEEGEPVKEAVVFENELGLKRTWEACLLISSSDHPLLIMLTQTCT